jgi:ribosomal protein S18 acetylase RimI-like enzyme
MSHDPPWIIRPLSHDDLPLYRPVRLEALRLHPEAFAASFEEEQDNDQSRMIGEFPSLTLGGFVQGKLVATAGYVVSPRIKQRHRGHVVGVYVAPSCRGTGLAPALIRHLIREAKSTGLLLLTLSVTVGNRAARQLYLRAGFTIYGLEPLGLRIGQQLFDEELMVLRLDRNVASK